MKAIRVLAVSVRVLATAAVAAILMGGTPAWGQVDCTPPCGAGQMCVQGTCMVPAQPPANYPPAPPAQGAPPAYQQQPPPAGAQGYPPPQGNYPPPQGGAYPPPQGNYPPPQDGAYPPPQGNYPPPQGGAYPPPPPGNYPPPQGGAYPPPPPGAYPPPPGPPPRSGFLAMPYIGINSFLGKTGEGLDTGFRLGALLGGRIGPMFSINGELMIDVLNLSNPPMGTDVSMTQFVLALSPLVHIPAGNIELVVGPKLGFFSHEEKYAAGGFTDKYTGTGLVAGFNAGLFGAVTPNMSVGGIISLDVRRYGEVCSTLSGEAEACSTDSFDLSASDKVLGMSGALLF